MVGARPLAVAVLGGVARSVGRGLGLRRARLLGLEQDDLGRRRVGEGAVRRVEGLTWLLALVERRGGAGCRRLGAGPEQSNRVDGKILETHGVKF